MKKWKRIWLTLAVANHRNRMIRKGVWTFARPSYPWMFIGANVSLTPQAMEASRDFDGAIGQVGSPILARAAAKTPCPFINIHGGDPLESLPQVGTDDRAIGRMAAKYYLGLGFKHFASIGFSWEGGESPGRMEGFRLGLTEEGFTPHEYLAHFDPLEEDPKAPTHRWIIELPKPVAIYCVNDLFSRWLADICLRLGLGVPDEVALLGTENSVTICEESYPQSSSIELPCEEVGHAAAKLLDHLMSGRKPPKKPILFPPKGIVVRKSTDFLALEDSVVARAVQFIRENLLQPRGDELSLHALSVEDVLREVLVSRSGLNLRFRKALGRTVFQEIRREQIHRVKQRLQETDMSMYTIARETGFEDGIALHRAFKKCEGMPPGAYRKQFRRTQPPALSLPQKRTRLKPANSD